MLAGPRQAALKPDFAALEAAGDGDPRTAVVDLTDVFCDAERCYPVIGDYVAYRDAVHLHTGFAPNSTPVLDRAIRNAVPPAVSRLLFGSAAAGGQLLEQDVRVARGQRCWRATCRRRAPGRCRRCAAAPRRRGRRPAPAAPSASVRRATL